MPNQIHDPQAYLVVSVKDSIQDHLHVDEFAGAGDRYVSITGSHGDPGKYPADMADAQWSTKPETARAFLSGSEPGSYPAG